ncbi:hypothetical protein MT1_3781 [Pseudomonas sp. MT-1]|uniref:DUF7446 family protein n=1 Tax=Stutzerimonas stutzeri TaxID=316 RepID=UPI000535FB71|nr:hypothetical protein [Stutzerimonas stutzeri]MCQ4282603.1 hypothetical protein [Stutzerimonas stutzeri]BAP80956.1 hypothetical protein MT1_3781 [Pseudomonas sp. MT-1]
MKPIRMQVTALGGRIMAGHTNKAGTQLTEGSRQDVTSDFMKCLLQKAEHHGGGFEILGDGKSWDVTIRELSPTPSPAMDAKEE